ncbi:ATP-dependent helicase [Candidatus Shapirobacteria bacterium]|nr:ATP-dependent helicase [Candidatus Shapirobacteria bacterium]
MTFLDDYQKLNPAQRLAVDTIEGPVMVVAGAGTGKTQTIALRIANILAKTQTPPSSILCLTFTDNAAFNMRQRLLQIIGPVAYSVKVHTFHSFCNEIIQSHPEYFIFAKEAKVVDQLEQIEIFQKLIDSLPDGATLKPWGEKYYYLRDVGSLIQTLKRENITPATFENLISNEQYFVDQSKEIFDQIRSLRLSKDLDSQLVTLNSQLTSIPNLSGSIHSLIVYHLSLYRNGGYDIGAAKTPAVNFKNALLKLYDTFAKNIPKQQELLTLYIGYQSELKTRSRYDFDDMIIFVLRALSENSDLLLEYQEKFQYILVDEYQDTNASQNQIIELLGSYYDSPNIFVVGDDDQSIFRFQGASLENLQNFLTKYKVEPIVLTNNYRSHQLILDSASQVINHNQNRLGNLIKTIDKNLQSQLTADPDPINLTVTDSLLSENYLVATKIQELLQNNVPASEIAIIYRNNHDVDELTEILSSLKIPFYLPADQNILKSKPILHLINLLSYINNPLDQTLLFPILSSEFINFNSLDLLHLLRKEPLSPKSQKKLDLFNRRVAKARVRLERYSPDKFFNYVIRHFRFLRYCLKSKNISILNQLYTFYNELKRLSTDEHFSLSQFLNRLRLYQENNIALPAPPLTANVDSSVQLMTAHKAKGLEFAHVFIIQTVDKKWGNNPDRGSIKLPPGIINTELSLELNDSNEDERRLFYVALTRAKSQIYLSYSSKNNSSRDQLPSVFLSEIDPKLIQTITPPAATQESSLITLFAPKISSQKTSVSLSQYLDAFLQKDYIFNVTHLNSYLRCPYCFYHNTILRVPQSKDKFSSFGTAIHAALSTAYTSTGNPYDKFVSVLNHEHLPLADYQESLTLGKTLLDDYLANYPITKDIDHLVDFDFKHDHVHMDNIPLTGKIDLINVLNNKEVEVVDFKTGNPDGKYKELSEDGDYFRQLVFYKLLSTLDLNFKYEVVKGTIDFVQKSKQKGSYTRREFTITDEHLANLKTLITKVYAKILAQDFFHVGPDCKNKKNLHYLLK